MADFSLKFEQLTQRIGIYNKLVSRDEIGGEIVSKTLWKQCWAKVEPQFQRQKYAQHISQNEQALLIHMRYQTGISNQMIIVFNDCDYEIRSVVNMEFADCWLEILVVTNEEI